jgi:hypothetical protein
MGYGEERIGMEMINGWRGRYIHRYLMGRFPLDGFYL